MNLVLRNKLDFRYKYDMELAVGGAVPGYYHPIINIVRCLPLTMVHPRLILVQCRSCPQK